MFTKSQRDRNRALTEINTLFEQANEIAESVVPQEVEGPVSEDRAREILASVMKVIDIVHEIRFLIPRINKGSGRMFANRFSAGTDGLEQWVDIVGGKIDSEHPALTAPLREAADLRHG